MRSSKLAMSNSARGTLRKALMTSSSGIVVEAVLNEALARLVLTHPLLQLIDLGSEQIVGGAVRRAVLRGASVDQIREGVVPEPELLNVQHQLHDMRAVHVLNLAAIGVDFALLRNTWRRLKMLMILSMSASLLHSKVLHDALQLGEAFTHVYVEIRLDGLDPLHVLLGALEGLTNLEHRSFHLRRDHAEGLITRLELFLQDLRVVGLKLLLHELLRGLEGRMLFKLGLDHLAHFGLLEVVLEALADVGLHLIVGGSLLHLLLGVLHVVHQVVGRSREVSGEMVDRAELLVRPEPDIVH